MPFIPVDVSVLAEKHLADISIAGLGGQVQSGPGLFKFFTFIFLIFLENIIWQIWVCPTESNSNLQPGLLIEHVDTRVHVEEDLHQVDVPVARRQQQGGPTRSKEIFF